MIKVLHGAKLVPLTRLMDFCLILLFCKEEWSLPANNYTVSLSPCLPVSLCFHKKLNIYFKLQKICRISVFSWPFVPVLTIFHLMHCFPFKYCIPILIDFRNNHDKDCTDFATLPNHFSDNIDFDDIQMTLLRLSFPSASMKTISLRYNRPE